MALGGPADTLPEMAPAMGSIICASRSLDPSGDTCPGGTIQHDTLPCFVRPRYTHLNRHE